MSDVPYVVTFEAQASGHSVSCPLDGQVPMPKEGGGGYEEVPLNKRSPVLVWKGRSSLLKIDIPIVFDGTVQQVAVAPSYTTLRHMYRPPDATVPPPVLQVSLGGGTGMDVVPYLDEVGDWVLSELQWGEAVGDGQGRREQQHFIATITEYVPDERLTPVSAQKPKHPIRTYVIQRKDIAGGLGKLATRFHLASWKVLANAQAKPPKDPRLTERDIGRKLIVPLGGNAGLVVLSGTPQQSSGG